VGIGRYLYSLDSPWVALEPRGRSYVILKSELPRLKSLLGSVRHKAPVAHQTIEQINEVASSKLRLWFSTVSHWISEENLV
jgi:hypothetical protein